MYRKNTASQYIGFTAINASTGATMTGTTGFAAYRVLDGGAQASATGSVTDKGNGQYSFALSQADTNGNDCSILFTMTSMIAVEKTFVTTACDPTVATNFGITALPATACTTNASLITSGTGTAQLSVTSGLVTLAAVTHTGAVIPTVTTTTTATNLTNLPAITTDWLTGTGVAASAVTKIQAGLATPTNITAGTITNVTNLTNAATAGDFTATQKASIGTAVAASAVASVTGSVGSVASGGITSTSFGAGAITAAAIATDAIDADALATDAVNEIADGLLGRNVSGGSSAGRTVKQALHFLRNKWVISAGTMTVYDTDDTTSSWTSTITTTASNPVTTSDPS